MCIRDSLNAAVRLINTLRKVNGNIDKKVNAATKLVWSSCYDLGLVYVYASKAKFSEIEVCIRKLIRSAGLDSQTKNELIYQVSTHLTPELMAKKQIIQLGVKFLNLENVTNNRYLIKIEKDDHLKPFWNKFQQEFNKLPLELRKFVISNTDVLDKKQMQKVKNKLRQFYRYQCNPLGPLSKEKRLKVLTSNIYSKERVEKRKERAVETQRAKNFSTPKGMRQRTNSVTFNRLHNICNAPYREFRSVDDSLNNTEDSFHRSKRICIRPSLQLSTPLKRKTSMIASPRIKRRLVSKPKPGSENFDCVMPADLLLSYQGASTSPQCALQGTNDIAIQSSPRNDHHSHGTMVRVIDHQETATPSLSNDKEANPFEPIGHISSNQHNRYELVNASSDPVVIIDAEGDHGAATTVRLVHTRKRKIREVCPDQREPKKTTKAADQGLSGSTRRSHLSPGKKML